MAKARDGKKGRQPDWNVSAVNKKTDRRGQIGVGWTNDDGSISINLNMQIVIDTRTDDLTIRLFPNDYKIPDRSASRPAESTDDDDLESGDPIPF